MRQPKNILIYMPPLFRAEGLSAQSTDVPEVTLFLMLNVKMLNDWSQATVVL